MSRYNLDHIFVNDSKQLASVCRQLQSCTDLAFDTEFMRTNTYYAHFALLQIFDGQITYLIDPTAIDSLTPLVPVWEDPSITKYVHGGTEDLEVIWHTFGLIPSNVLDSQILSAFLGHPFQLSYQKLVDELLGVKLCKAETRTDWLKRPLNDDQLLYAVQDVVYLYSVSRQLCQALSEQNKLDWAIQECHAQLDPKIFDNTTPSYKVKKVGKLSYREKLILEVLNTWREHKAQDYNRPRQWILSDQTLGQYAKTYPKPKTDGDLTKKVLDKYHAEWENLIQALPKTDKPYDKTWHLWMTEPLKACQQRVAELSEQYNITRELLACNRFLQRLVSRHYYQNQPWFPYQYPNKTIDWRKPLLSEPLQKVLADYPNKN